MEVKCPSCSSRFNLADNVARPNAKLRCSVCKNVFTIDAPPRPDDDQMPDGAGGTIPDDMDLDLDGNSSSGNEAKPKGKKGKLFVLLFVLVLLCGGGAGGWWYYTQYMVEATPEDSTTLAKSVELMTMRNVRQYYVENEKIGSVFVIEGIVVNEFPVAKDLIEVEAAIYGQDKTALMLKKQLAGTVLSLFQLQVLGEEELEAFLSNQIEILSRNTNIPPKGEVPFMVLFYNPPPDVAEFGVKIISAKDIDNS